MEPKNDRAPPNGHRESNGAPMSEGRWRSRRRTTQALWIAAVVGPILVFIFTQLDFVQDAKGWFVHGLTDWDLGKKDIVADIFAPIWVLSLVAIAALERRLIDHYVGEGRQPADTGVLSLGRVRAATWLATIGAGVIVLMSWSREWVRFGENPDAFWYVLTILGVIGLLLVPVWWLRYSIFTDIRRAIENSPNAHRIGRYLFNTDGPGSRWLLLFTFSAITGLVAFTVLSQLDALLKGMHPSGGVSIGMNGLASVFELDLSVKPAQIVERVGSWFAYSDSVGSSFASGYSVSTAYLLIESFVLIPAYGLCIAILLLQVRRTPPDGLDSGTSQSYALVNGIGFMALAVLVSADLVENLMTWVVIHSAWFTPETISSWTVRLMWFGAMFRTLALGSLIAVAVLSIAFRAARYRWLGDALVAVRGQLLVVVFVTAALGLAQVEDVIRRWTVSVALLTVAMATGLAVLVQWTSANTLTQLRRDRRAVEDGTSIEPSVMHVPWSREPVTLRRLIVLSILGMAVAQVLLVGAFGLPVGLGFVVPAVLIAGLWLFGIPLPARPFVRGDRHIDRWVQHWFPGVLGSAVYIVLGLVVIRAATTQLVFARHADPWLLFCLLPLVLGIYRIHTKSWATMGGLEFVTIIAVVLFGVALFIARGDPELSPVALVFTGLMIVYGSMPFFYSYASDSLPSLVVRDRIPWLKVQPLLIGGAVIAVIMGLAIVVWPLQVPSRIGTIAVVLLGAMLFAGFAAAAVIFAEKTRPPKLIAAFQLKRTPVFLFMLAWVAAAGVAATGAANEVPLIVKAGVEHDRVVVGDVWDRWVAANASDPSEEEAIPLVFIAASGGGIRAAAWTSYVMDCVFVGSVADSGCVPQTDARSSIVLTSGVSGGSLGIASWAASVVNPDAVSGSTDWVKDHLGDDYLAGAMAWLLLVDTPRSFVGFGPSIRDRAEILEQAFEQSWPGDGTSLLSEGIFDVWEHRRDVPLMVFNGTSVNDPCRFNSSVLTATAHTEGSTCTSLEVFEGRERAVEDAATLAATKDLVDFLCPDQDVRVSTAALLSARFPVISPTGRVGGSLGDCGEEPEAAFSVDGGYLEGSGAGTVTEVAQRLESNIDAWNQSHDACIVPFMIQIDNGYENPGAAPLGASPIEVLVPIRTLISSQFGRIAHAREQAAIEFDRPFEIGGAPVEILAASGTPITSRYARITTRAHPGVQAPLGWTLSDASFDDLQSQLGIFENRRELSEIRRWLTGDLTCIATEPGP